MAGYFENPEADREAFSRDGWFNTGDLAFIRNGAVTITGRTKDVVIVNGINYHSYEIEAIVERFKDMREDIDKERKFMLKAWAKREAQVNAVIESTVGMVGDLHGIMGQSMPEIAAIESTPMLEGKAA